MISKSNQAFYQIYRNKDAVQSTGETYGKTNDLSAPNPQHEETENSEETPGSYNNMEEKIVSERDGGT